MDSGVQDSISLNGQASIVESNLVDKLDLECDEEWSSSILLTEDRPAYCAECYCALLNNYGYEKPLIGLNPLRLP